MQLEPTLMTLRPTALTPCQSCRTRQSCFISAQLPDEDGACAGVVRRRRQLPQGERLFRRHASFSSLYQVCSGSIKTQRDTLDGGLFVSGFFFPGDIVGIESIGHTQYTDDAIALTDTAVCQLDFQRLLSLCTGKPGINAWMIGLIGTYLRRKDGDLAWSTALPADRRVLRFFLDLKERLAGGSTPPQQPLYYLPMRKQDIAFYLRMTPETFSRNLAILRRKGLLQVDHDRFFLPDTSRARELTRL
ncbi:MAG TPA: Crp/Fnr family transcriptional regulator [Gammaproteobacteria bacterium]|nr:Crp/Fnr family transcriptional regulator [Chromatiales bacterium]HPQ25078.1 Crp/Fnr family transcriptional regulator [Gammaproteobacteria bacterium]